jgi:hypothetical protein
MPRFVKNPTLAEDGLPRECYSDVNRACDRFLRERVSGYKDYNKKTQHGDIHKTIIEPDNVLGMGREERD